MTNSILDSNSYIFCYYIQSNIVPGDVEVGKLKIVKYPGQKSEVSLTLSDATMQVEPKEKIPKDHRFDVQAVTQQTLGVFSQIRKFYNRYLNNQLDK